MIVSTALITGAGAGLGATIARRLAADGWAIVVNDVNPAAATAVAESIIDAGGRALPFIADATDPPAVGEMVVAAREALGPVLTTVANACGPQDEVPIGGLGWSHLLAHLEFFAKSPLALLQAALPDMRAARWGRVVHIGSDMFHRGASGWSAYMAAKGALLGLTRGWALELGSLGITVNSVSPGWIPVERHGVISPEAERERMASQAIPRWGSPDDVAGAVSYLVSDDAGFVTGQELAVNGGTYFG